MHTPPVDPSHAAAEASLERLYVEQRDRLTGYLRHLVGDQATAEDLVQETFVKALGAWTTRHATASATAWVYRIATNTAYDELRRRRRARVTPFPDEARTHLVTPTLDGTIVEADAVRRALTAVPDLYREPLLLQVQGGQRVDEIAMHLNVAVGTVKSRLSRGREYFRRAYDGAGGRNEMQPVSRAYPRTDELHGRITV